MTIVFLTWDYKGGDLSAKRLVAALDEFRGRPVWAVQVEDGGDDYVVALSDVPMTSEQAYAAWVPR